ncbi:RagB/SusD family nutrient uptake outer membrane protein [Flammeovirga yaeyamensis]|uniref:RagB/SusD family nutrient uptake outer membrane protein n=1 Tax=Flammeovirga yaeyamensis TaxID=367791 RepID=A0AAX1NE49_9BACT|nr:RagB/SusD family nutrient uptake outer membrane protein [Flammeovirga yaeyamensis]MBB3697192.1 tetratricopeptide (TPR) repeat protein [Flammeovirga yaeyamensis]NMF33852.1 RagB/SusD family nutrient uptake outer membrane protein [Flammeovirga yaeyamensis]QWG04886.1 RagB/SusD family nutrient uptake outer membrane protein [Flammeovirga yaeyamensis]
MKNIFNKSIVAAGVCFATLFTTSCESFLDDAKVQVDVDSNTYYNSIGEAEMATNAVYTPLHWYGLYKRHRYLLDFMSGDMETTSGAVQLIEYEDFKFNANTAELIPKSWEASYAGIARANVVLDKVPAISVLPNEEERKAHYIGEAHFLRAFYYFNLVTLYGGVPIYDKPFDGNLSEEFLRPKRNTEAEVYALIETDLIKAEDMLLSSYTGDNIGRATSGAAQALLGKVYLYQQKYSEARDALKKVIDGEYAAYDLVPFEQNFVKDFENNQESVFEIQFMGGIGSPWPDYDTNQSSKANWVSTAISPFQFANAIPSLEVDGYFNDYPEENDIRRTYTIAREGDEWSGEIITAKPHEDNGWHNRTSERDANYIIGCRKFAEDKTNPGFNQSPVNFRQMRFAEVLLMFAEAENEVNGPSVDAYSAVNRVRERAGVDNFPTGLSASEFFVELVHERRKEFTFEFQRFFDLVRWSKRSDAASLPEFAKPTYMPGFVVGKNELLPIPAVQIQQNPNLTQNPGY